jgi:hypothetical protein
LTINEWRSRSKSACRGDQRSNLQCLWKSRDGINLVNRILEERWTYKSQANGHSRRCCHNGNKDTFYAWSGGSERLIDVRVVCRLPPFPHLQIILHKPTTVQSHAVQKYIYSTILRHLCALMRHPTEARNHRLAMCCSNLAVIASPHVLRIRREGCM